jgi:ectoine hydroxylase-related dioxygenase (phytanoyl-CoA dioxygenase family)
MELSQLQMQINGFCVIEDVIPADRCAQVRDSLLATVERVGLNSSAPEGVGFVPGVINHDQSFAPYLADERLLSLAGALLGDHLRISFTSAIINRPGNARGGWHADWPFNQNNAGYIPAPYPDTLMHLTTLWMLSSFNEENSGTLLVPGSHRSPSNPTAGNGVDPLKPFPSEIQAKGPAGSVLVMDSRLWHATSPNKSNEPRVALAVRYAPWWLNTEVLRPESLERRRMCRESGKDDNQVPSVPRDVFERLPQNVKPLYQHWVAGPSTCSIES